MRGLAASLLICAAAAAGPGDVDNNGVLDADDVHWMHVFLSIGQSNPGTDSDEDGDTDADDLYHLVTVRLGHPYGDLDWDGDVDTADQLIMLVNWTGAVQSPIPPHLVRTYFEGDIKGPFLNPDLLVNVVDWNEQLLHWTGPLGP